MAFTLANPDVPTTLVRHVALGRGGWRGSGVARGTSTTAAPLL